MCLAVCLTFVGCNKGKEPPVDLVKSVVVSSNFYNQEIYVEDYIELKDFSVLVTYESGEKETLSLSSFGVEILNTSIIGKQALNLKYKNKEFSVNYEVLEIVPMNAMYKGKLIELYRNEDVDFSNNFISVVYNNGEEHNICFDDCVISEIDYSLTNEDRFFTVTFNGVSAEVPYAVTNRPIELNKDYIFDDTLGIFEEHAEKIRFTESGYIVHNDVYSTGQGIEEGSFNRFVTKNIYNNKLVDICFYLVNDTVYCELL